MQVPEASLNPFYKYEDEDDKRTWAYASNLSSMFAHLKRLDQTREENENNNSNFSDAEQLDIAYHRKVTLGTVHEEENDESDMVGNRIDTSEVVDNDSVSDPVANKPNSTSDKRRRATMMTEMTVQTENQQDQSSDENGEEANPPWVDRVKLRHGMDWLDLIKNEVERDTAISGNINRNSRPKSGILK